jgi:DNA/RNA-binding domain of Phe-tRNA-synthetase-like protein
MIPIEATQAWKAAYPEGAIGLLEVANVDNRAAAPELEARKRAIEQALREKYAGFNRAQFAALPVLRDYVRYYKRFDKTYHVLQQLESVALKGKALPSVSPLVDANFAAELETLVLTAAHDAARLESPVVIDVSGAADTMTQMSGTTKTLPAGDMVMRDADGVSCSILYGQDQRSPVSADTTRALYVAYGPPGVSENDLRRQLDAVLSHLRTFAPGCAVEQLGVVTCRGTGRAAASNPS